MSRSIPVAKMHGACNDFIVLDARAHALDAPEAFARRYCDRRRGIGADGLIVIDAARNGGLSMRTFNADGSEAEMCGNGVRCAARWLDESGAGSDLIFATAAGPVRTRVVARAPEYLVRVLAGTPRVTAYASAASGDGFAVALGNPHLVFFRDGIDAIDVTALALGVQRDPALPRGANVHVAEIESAGRVRARHWERGVGETPACGTGAIAVAAAAMHAGLMAAPVEVFVPGGRLLVEWDGRGEAALTGPAERAFDTIVEHVE